MAQQVLAIGTQGMMFVDKQADRFAGIDWWLAASRLVKLAEYIQAVEC